MAKILVVDDNRSKVDALVFNLNLSGHEAIGAFSAAEAKSLLDSSFNLAIVDYEMLPGENGVELASWINEYALPVPVIIHSGVGEGEIMSDNPKYGQLKRSGVIAEYTPKDHQRLLEALQRTLNKPPVKPELINPDIAGRGY